MTTVAPGLDALTLKGRAGGTVNSGVCGYISQRPNHRLRVSQDLDYAKLLVIEPAGSSVLVNGADGSFCGIPIPPEPAQISGYWKAGIYEVFVGSPEPQVTPPYRLLFTVKR
ncbi:MAG: hypothetical protein Q6J33_03725 [Gloeomargarita sp. DG_2_bins_126]